jgi:hypothetical protein
MSAPVMSAYGQAVRDSLGDQATPEVLAFAEVMDRRADDQGLMWAPGATVAADAGIPAEDVRHLSGVLRAAGLLDVRKLPDGRRIPLVLRPLDDVTVPDDPSSLCPEDGPEGLPAEPDQAPCRVLVPENEVDYRASLMRSDLSPMAMLAGVAIVFRCWKSKELFAGQAEVAEWMHLSEHSRKHVKGYLAELVAAGYLRPIGSHRRTTRYLLTLPDVADSHDRCSYAVRLM